MDLINAAERVEFFQQATKDRIPTLLINNAGFGTVSRFSEVDINRELDMISLNCQALVDLSHRAYQSMKDRGSGSIVNVASIAAYQPVTFMTTYAATKAFVHNFSLALNAEAKEHGVHVMSHCPGPTESEFHLVSGLDSKLDKLSVMTAEEVVALSLIHI